MSVALDMLFCLVILEQWIKITSIFSVYAKKQAVKIQNFSCIIIYIVENCVCHTVFLTIASKKKGLLKNLRFGYIMQIPCIFLKWHCSLEQTSCFCGAFALSW